MYLYGKQNQPQAWIMIPKLQPLNAYEVKRNCSLQFHQNASCVGVQHSKGLGTYTFHLKLCNKHPSIQNTIQFNTAKSFEHELKNFERYYLKN